MMSGKYLSIIHCIYIFLGKNNEVFLFIFRKKRKENFIVFRSFFYFYIIIMYCISESYERT